MFEIVTSRQFDADFERLARFDFDAAVELRDLMSHELRVDGMVQKSYAPHKLNNRGCLYNGCAEFHIRNDVLVLYSPWHPKNAIRMRRICTHEELRTGHFHEFWPVDGK